MKKISITLALLEFDSVEELTPEDRLLLLEAKSALQQAYAPYSNYGVGAAIRLSNGLIVRGNNQENMAYPSGLCAERVAIFAASSNYPGIQMEAIAISATHLSYPSTSPSASCGACRQVLLEYELNQRQPIRLIMQGTTGPVHVVEKVSDLLPLFFNEEKLKNNSSDH